MNHQFDAKFVDGNGEQHTYIHVQRGAVCLLDGKIVAMHATRTPTQYIYEYRHGDLHFTVTQPLIGNRITIESAGNTFKSEPIQYRAHPHICKNIAHFPLGPVNELATKRESYFAYKRSKHEPLFRPRLTENSRALAIAAGILSGLATFALFGVAWTTMVLPYVASLVGRLSIVLSAIALGLADLFSVNAAKAVFQKLQEWFGEFVSVEQTGSHSASSS